MRAHLGIDVNDQIRRKLNTVLVELKSDLIKFKFAERTKVESINLAVQIRIAKGGDEFDSQGVNVLEVVVFCNYFVCKLLVHLHIFDNLSVDIDVRVFLALVVDFVFDLHWGRVAIRVVHLEDEVALRLSFTVSFVVLDRKAVEDLARHLALSSDDLTHASALKVWALSGRIARVRSAQLHKNCCVL